MTRLALLHDPPPFPRLLRLLEVELFYDVVFLCENARITAYTNKQYIYFTNVCTVTEIDCKESTTKDKPRSGKIEQTCNPPVLA